MLDKLSPVPHFKTYCIQHYQQSLTFLTGYLGVTQVDDLHLPQKAEQIIKMPAFDCITSLQLHVLQNKLHHIDFVNTFQIMYASNKPAM